MSPDSNARLAIAVECLRPGHRDRHAALGLVLGGGSRSEHEVNTAVGTLLEIVELQQLNLDLVVAGKRGSRLICACCAVASPGRSGMVFMGPDGGLAGSSDVAVEMLGTLQCEAWNRDMVLLQALTSPGANTSAKIYTKAGFTFLAELVYMDATIDNIADRRPSGSPDLTYLSYLDAGDSMFIRALDATYVDSLDCPGLTGLRETHDVLLGHRHTGIHDPLLWWIALRGNEPAGVMLLSQVPGRRSSEIVYMGVVPEARGQGVGDALLHHAVRACVTRDIDSLTLAVDSTNRFAWRMYTRWGFTEASRRRAWILRRPW